MTTTNTKKITINHLNIIAVRKLELDSCAICYQDILKKCSTCESENKNIKCYSVIGECSHVYHYCCIMSWINTQMHALCPMCKQQWNLKKRSI